MSQDTVPPAAPSDRQCLDLGNWLGRGQAFSLIANKCTAAQAQCLKTIREQGAYRSLGLSWEDFCQQHLGLSRSHADQLIRQLDQLGAAYFHLAEFMRISPDFFRRIAPAVHDDCIEIVGELVPITPGNALKIKQAVLAWQKDSQRARAELAKAQAANASIISLKSRLDACLAEMSAILGGPREGGQDAALRGLLSYTLTELKRLQRDLDRILA
jgi:hypothetical protein